MRFKEIHYYKCKEINYEYKRAIKKKRNENNITQEQIAEMIFVSRQTISNWENGKSYPDIKSSVLLCDIYKISLEELVRGDVELMKKEISKDEFLGNGSMILFSLISFMIGLGFISRTTGTLQSITIVTTVVLAVLTLFYSFKGERMKKKANIKTYREILTYFEEKR